MSINIGISDKGSVITRYQININFAVSHTPHRQVVKVHTLDENSLSLENFLELFFLQQVHRKKYIAPQKTGTVQTDGLQLLPVCHRCIKSTQQSTVALFPIS